ncbi:MAG: hypothetical protein WDN28_15650 [Chthoniobacter sp.]
MTNGGTLTTGSTILTTHRWHQSHDQYRWAPAQTGRRPRWSERSPPQFGGAGTASFTVDDHATFTYATNGFFNVGHHGRRHGESHGQ